MTKRPNEGITKRPNERMIKRLKEGITITTRNTE